jgi:hypothetical protein
MECDARGNATRGPLRRGGRVISGLEGALFTPQNYRCSCAVARCAEWGRAMGFRFRRSIRLAPGLRLNVGLKSSVSTGIRGLSYTAGSAGQRITVGLPGTGLYWTKAWRNSAAGVAGSRIFLAALGILILFSLAIGALTLLGH